MKNSEFKNFLFDAAVISMACDGNIAKEEITELEQIVSNEIYFMNYEFDIRLKNQIDTIKEFGNTVVNNFLEEITNLELNQNQKILLIEVILKIIMADNQIENNELRFLKLVLSRLNIEEETLILKFPNHINILVDFKSFKQNDEFCFQISL